MFKRIKSFLCDTSKEKEKKERKVRLSAESSAYCVSVTLRKENRGSQKSSQCLNESLFNQSYTSQIFESQSLAELRTIKIVGRGRSGKVMLVQSSRDRLFYAMKVVNFKYLKQKNMVVKDSLPGTDLKYSSPFTAQVYRVFFSKQKAYIVFEFIQGGQLMKHLHSNNRFQEIWGMFYAAQLLVALQSIHRNRLVFRSLNPNAILIDIQGNIKLVDYGKKVIDTSEHFYNQNPVQQMYMAPEVVLGHEHDFTADFWSLGMIIYEMLNGALPFYSRDKWQMLERISSEPIRMKGEFSPESTHLVENLLLTKPRNRLGQKGVTQLMEHPWFANVDWNKIRSLDYEPPIKPNLASSYDTRYFDQQVRNDVTVDSPINSQLPPEFGSQVQSHLTMDREDQQTRQLKFSVGMAMDMTDIKESNEIVITSQSVD